MRYEPAASPAEPDRHRPSSCAGSHGQSDRAERGRERTRSATAAAMFAVETAISNGGPDTVIARASTTPSPTVAASIANALSRSTRRRGTGVESSRSRVLCSSSPAIARAGADREDQEQHRREDREQPRLEVTGGRRGSPRRTPCGAPPAASAAVVGTTRRSLGCSDRRPSSPGRRRRVRSPTRPGPCAVLGSSWRRR